MKALIVHIGTGKTGSSSIQQCLTAAQAALAQKRVKYWGINLELAPGKPDRAWQTSNGTSLIQMMDSGIARQEIFAALNEAISSLEDGEIAIWSNESIHEMPEVYIPILQEAQATHRINIEIIAYARNAYSYTKSAYNQWGIMHKTNHGPVKGYTEWVNENLAFLSYGIKLHSWDESFSDSFKLVNYDYVDDVRNDFLGRIPGCKDLLPCGPDKRDNVSPTETILAIYALYNSLFEDPIHPQEISSLLRRNAITACKPLKLSLPLIFPTNDETLAAASLLKEDQEITNAILARKAEPQLSTSEDLNTNQSRHEEIEILRSTLALLINMAVQQEKKIQLLESRASALESYG